MAIGSGLYVSGSVISGGFYVSKVWTHAAGVFTEIHSRSATAADCMYTACARFSIDNNLYVCGRENVSEGFIEVYDGASWTTEYDGGANTIVDDVVEFNNELYAIRFDGAALTSAVYARGAGDWTTNVLTCAENNSVNSAGCLFKAYDGLGIEYLFAAPYSTFTGSPRCYYTSDGAIWNSLGDFGVAGWCTLSYMFYDNHTNQWRAWFKGAVNERVNPLLAAVGWLDGGNPGHNASDITYGDYYKDASNDVFVAPRQEDHYRKYTAAGWVDDYNFVSVVDVIYNERSSFGYWDAANANYGVANTTGPDTGRLLRYSGGAWTLIDTYPGAYFAGVVGGPLGCVYDGSITGTYTITQVLHT